MENLTNIGSEFYQAIKEHYPMSSTAQTLDDMMGESLQDGGYAVPGGRDLFMEVMDTATGLVWMSAAPVQLADFAALKLEASMVKVSIARAAMDSADKGVRALYSLGGRTHQLFYLLAKGL